MSPAKPKVEEKKEVKRSTPANFYTRYASTRTIKKKENIVLDETEARYKKELNKGFTKLEFVSPPVINLEFGDTPVYM